MNKEAMKIISGGQTGVDQGALDFALKHDWPCGGWCPPGRKNRESNSPGIQKFTSEFLELIFYGDM